MGSALGGGGLSQTAADGRYLKLSGGTLTGAVLSSSTITGSAISANAFSLLADSWTIASDPSGITIGDVFGDSILLNISAISAARTRTFLDVSGTEVVDTAVQTLTNKTLTSPTLTSPSIGGTGLRISAGSSTDGAVSALQTAAGDGETITTAALGLARYTTNGAARIGVILQSGTYNGQVVTVINEDTTAANSIIFAAVATSHVANGVTCVINGLQGRRFVWSASAATPAWYELK